MEYATSGAEIKRRKLAYISLSISLIAGTFISSIIYQFPIPGIAYLALFISLFMLGALSFYFFRKISNLKIALLKNSLQRRSTSFLEEYSLTKIKKVKIKWTKHDSIREIYIWMNDGESVFITALKKFEKFRTDLLAKVDKQAIVYEWHEPINFDSFLFYPILGFLISNLNILVFKNLLRLNYQQIKYGIWFFGGYLLIFGLYFIIATPISKRSGNKAKQQDYIMGILLLISGILSFSA